MAQRLTSDEVKGLFEKLSNWGKWGKDDERGALNFITDAKRAAAAALVKTGETISMSLPLATLTSNDNPTPVTHLMMQAGTDSPRQSMAGVADYFAISPHGFATTHLDALCHVFWQGKMYNGFDAAEVGSHGAKKCSIEVTREGWSAAACCWTSRRSRAWNGSNRAIISFPRIWKRRKRTTGSGLKKATCC